MAALYEAVISSLEAGLALQRGEIGWNELCKRITISASAAGVTGSTVSVLVASVCLTVPSLAPLLVVMSPALIALAGVGTMARVINVYRDHKVQGGDAVPVADSFYQRLDAILS